MVTTTEVKVTNNMTNHPDMLTDKELVDVTAVFRSLETGLRGATIDPQDLHKAMKRLGLNPSDQEMVDIPNRQGVFWISLKSLTARVSGSLTKMLRKKLP